jgi:RHS repeat-associated protein
MEGEPITEENGVFYLLRDHLGSASVTVKEDSGALTKYAELRYKPWGEDRPTSEAFNETQSPSERRFTGQRAHDELGLYHYQARWYDPVLGRFLQPDSIVPESQGVQALDRYAYVNNSPVRYTDPTGHWLDEGYGQCECGEETNSSLPKHTGIKGEESSLPFDSTLGGNLDKPSTGPDNSQIEKTENPPNPIGIGLGVVVMSIGVSGFAIGIGVAFEDPPVGLLLASASIVIVAFGADITYRSLGDIRPPSWPKSLLNIEGLKHP